MKIGIYALGLIGGSLLKSLKLFDRYKLIAVTRNKDTIVSANEYADVVSDDINILKDCEVVFVCTPINKTLEILDKLESILSPGTIVSDVASLKEFVSQKDRPYCFIGSHPMAGTEDAGFENSFKELFRGAKWVLTPSVNIPQKNIDILKEIIELTGAKPVIMNAASHDRAAALISHMPMLISQALMNVAMSDRKALLLAASGFRDMTRLSMSNTEMAQDMINLNKENIAVSLEMLEASVRSLLSDHYREKIEDIKEFRKSMYDNDNNNVINL